MKKKTLFSSATAASKQIYNFVSEAYANLGGFETPRDQSVHFFAQFLGLTIKVNSITSTGVFSWLG